MKDKPCQKYVYIRQKNNEGVIATDIAFYNILQKKTVKINENKNNFLRKI